MGDDDSKDKEEEEPVPGAEGNTLYKESLAEDAEEEPEDDETDE